VKKCQDIGKDDSEIALVRGGGEGGTRSPPQSIARRAININRYGRQIQIKLGAKHDHLCCTGAVQVQYKTLHRVTELETFSFRWPYLGVELAVTPEVFIGDVGTPRPRPLGAGAIHSHGLALFAQHVALAA